MLFLGACSGGADPTATALPADDPSPTATVAAPTQLPPSTAATATPAEPGGSPSDSMEPEPTALPTDASFTDDIAGYSIAYPAAWTVETDGPSVLISNPEGASVSITVEPLQEVSIDEYATLYLDDLGGGTFESTGEDLFADPPGFLVSGEARISGRDALVTTLLVDHFGSAIAITGSVELNGEMVHQITVEDVIATASFFTPLVFLPDTHGNEPTTATAAQLDTRVAGAIVDTLDADFFSFEGRAGVTYEIDVELLGLDDSLVTLFGSAGDCLITSNDDHAGSFASRLVWPVTLPGIYHIAVTNADALSTGAYGVTVRESSDTPADSHGNRRCSATPLTTGQPLSSAIDEAIDVDFFSFEATQGATYTITLGPDTLPDAIVALFGPEAVDPLDFAEAVSGEDATIEWTAPADGTYYLDVENADQVSIGGYTLSVTIAG